MRILLVCMFIFLLFGNLGFAEVSFSDFDNFPFNEMQHGMSYWENVFSENSVKSQRDIKKVSLSLFPLENIFDIFKFRAKETEIKANNILKISDEYNSSHYDESQDNEKYYYRPFRWFELNFKL